MSEATSLLEFVNFPGGYGKRTADRETDEESWSWETLIEALLLSGAVRADVAAELATRSQPNREPELLEDAHLVRSVLRQTLGAFTPGDNVSMVNPEAFNGLLDRYRVQIRSGTRQRHLVLLPQGDDPIAHALAALVWSAVQLLSSDESVKRLRRCSACGRFFLDRSKNQSRRWCEMRGCGNRAKARRYYERRRAQGAERTGGWQADGVP